MNREAIKKIADEIFEKSAVIPDINKQFTEFLKTVPGYSGMAQPAKQKIWTDFWNYMKKSITPFVEKELKQNPMQLQPKRNKPLLQTNR